MKKQQQFLKNISYILDILIIVIAYSSAKKIILNTGLQDFNYNFLLLSIILWFSMSFFSKIYIEKTNKNVSVLGLNDRTAGHHKKVDNLPPDHFKIIKKSISIIQKSKKI